MSGPSLKPLSKGKCLQDLKVLYNQDIRKKNISLLCKTAPKLIEAAKNEDMKGNQEESYILYMRYLNIASYVQQTDEYKRKKPDLESGLSKDSVLHALVSAEKLSKSLGERYEEQEKKRSLQAELEKVPPKIETVTQEEKLSTEEKKLLPNSPERDSISCIELYHILQEDPSRALIMDVRPRNQFSESHINFDCCISIPEEILEPGCSAAKLAEKLPEESKRHWHKRLEVEYLVLLDRVSSSSNVQVESHLQHLRTIILKWDPSVEYRSKPLILDGGYEGWWDHYPMRCTNLKPQVPNQELYELLDIDDVTYPDINDEQPKFSRKDKPTAFSSSMILNGKTEEKEVSKIRSEDISEKDYSNNLRNLRILSTNSLLIPKDDNTPLISSNTPNIDRTSKSAAVQRYKELEEERQKGVKYSMNLSRDREAAESELKKLKQQQGRNELSEEERDTLYQNERNLQLRIQELQRSQRAKDAENEKLRKTLEEYERREHEASKSAGNRVKQSAEIKSLLEGDSKSSTVKERLGPSTPTGVHHNNIPIPASASGLKRSRSSPNIAQLVQEPDQKPSVPLFDRNTKPIIQKPQHIEFINRQRNFHEVYGNVKQGLTGLRNLGNSCYMNSILQCISNINVLSNYFCCGKYKEDLNRSPLNPTRGEVAEEVAQVIRHLWLGQYRSIACRNLKEVVGKHMDQFRGCGQQDAHEFLTFLMDWLHNDLKIQKEEQIKEVSHSSLKKSSEIDAVTGALNAWNDFKSRHESIMLTGFFIQQVSTVQCSSCHAKSMNFEEPTSNLTLLLPSAARCLLSDCLRLYTSVERISGYKCESCHALHDAQKSVDLCRLPPTLIIHLKRFYSDGFYQKRQTFVDFPLENLDMKNYTPSRGQSHTVYNLCGVSNHYGTLEGGHYTAYCKNGTKWYKFDDQDVSEISREDVKSANAYILFYAAVR